MTQNVERTVGLPPPIPETPVSVRHHPVAKNDNEDASRYRLTIEAVGDHQFVYKVLDRVTGEVIRQLPREEVEKLSRDPTYRGGRLIDTAV
ncbi:Uncharacterised protein [Brevundimonas vesicularis]|uniref:Flagellar protein FlaG n=1 Tax=Brevundimonas vesicularis TaxID=41276 RepID=A0A2X1B8L7_BREVE|nr:flagellar protein FlaG [Brevundimonas vesicularis]SPU53573.1 Uncharacterised protein [Brevundimonas vesicularis]